MPLNPTFELTPLHPLSYDYNSVASEYRHYGYLRCFGNFLNAWWPRRLEDQYNEDKAVLQYSPVPATTTFPSGWNQYSCTRMAMKTNAEIENQYLIIYHLSGSGEVDFFVNSNHVRHETVSGVGFVALLVDCPPSQTWWYFYMFLNSGYVELKGIECYIL